MSAVAKRVTQDTASMRTAWGWLISGKYGVEGYLELLRLMEYLDVFTHANGRAWILYYFAQELYTDMNIREQECLDIVGRYLKGKIKKLEWYYTQMMDSYEEPFDYRDNFMAYLAMGIMTATRFVDMSNWLLTAKIEQESSQVSWEKSVDVLDIITTEYERQMGIIQEYGNPFDDESLEIQD